MADFANPINPKFTQAPPFSSASPSIQRQRDGTLLSGAVRPTDAKSPITPRLNERLQNDVLQRLALRLSGEDALEDLRKKQHISTRDK